LQEARLLVRGRHRHAADVGLDAQEQSLELPAAGALGEVRGHQRLGVGRFLDGHQAALAVLAVHDFSRSSCGASTSMSFCRALNTRQRAVSSVMSSASPMLWNDRFSSARNRNAARNSLGSRPTARASSWSISRLIAWSTGLSSGDAASSGNGWRACRLERSWLAKAL